MKIYKLGRYIWQSRQLLNLPMQSQQVAKQAKMSRAYYSDIERGVKLPSYKKLCDICRILNIPLHVVEPMIKDELFQRWKG